MPSINSQGKLVYSFNEARSKFLGKLSRDIKEQQKETNRLERFKEINKMHDRMRQLILEGKKRIEIRDILLKEYPEAASDLAKSELSEGISKLDAQIMDQSEKFGKSEPR